LRLAKEEAKVKAAEAADLKAQEVAKQKAEDVCRFRSGGKISFNNPERMGDAGSSFCCSFFFAIEQMLTMLIWIILTIHIPCDHKGSSTGDLGIWEPPKWRVTHVEVENMDQ
jgi:hypothetical protein